MRASCRQVRYERFSTLLRQVMEEAVVNDEGVEAAWLAFRLLLSDWGRFRHMLGRDALPNDGDDAL